MIRYEGNVFEKNREFSFLFCDHADPEQREALKTIFMGKAGGAFAAWRGAFLLRLIALSYDRVSCVPPIPIDIENALKSECSCGQSC